MATDATEVFDSLARREKGDAAGLIHEVIETVDADFELLRHSIRELGNWLHQNAELENNRQHRQLAADLRRSACRWLTSPQPLDESIKEPFAMLGPVGEFRIQHGDQMADLLQAALACAEKLIEEPRRSALEEELLKSIRAAIESKTDFRIFCETRDHHRIELLLETAGIAIPGNQGPFLSSVRDYRESAPFETLIKIGPMRAKGIGATPEFILTSPRFARLQQIKWIDCADQNGFGEEPLLRIFPEQSRPRSARRLKPTETARRRPDQATIDRARATTTSRANDTADEFELWKESRESGFGQIDKSGTPAWILHLSGNIVVATAARHKFPSLDLLENPYQIRWRSVSGSGTAQPLEPEQFVALCDYDLETGADGLQTELGRRWKNALGQALEANAPDFISKLKANGSKLGTLPVLCGRWASQEYHYDHPAPGKVQDFELLVKTLREGDFFDPPVADTWWKEAWRAIRKSRSAAIASGHIEQDLEEELIQSRLQEKIDEAATALGQGENWKTEFLDDADTPIPVSFHRLFRIEPDLVLPYNELYQARTAEHFEQWRL